MPLRLKMLIAVIVLVFAGLAVSDVATYASIKSFLLQRVDQQLHSAVAPVDHTLDQITGSGPNFGPPADGVVVPPGTYGAFVDASGRIVSGAAVVFGYEGQQQHPPAPPRLPTGLPGSARNPSTGERLFTAAAAGGSTMRYRVIAAPLRNGAGSLVVAIPLTEVDQTLHRLLLIAGLVTVVVVLGLG